MAIIGIDLGTTNSLVAYWKSGEVVLIPNSFGNKLTPSVVSVMEEEILVGRAAKERKLTHEGETAASFKRFMGTKKKYELGKQIFTPAELSALVLKKLRQDAELYLNEPVEEAVITVPAYFNDKQRTDTKLAAKLAGLKVERLINEPSAAALAYQVQQKKEEACLLVFDFGGGTLDISLVECFDNVIEIEAVAGDNHLGGDDIDELIYNDFMQHHVEAAELNEEGISGLKKALTEAKSALGTKEETAFTYTYGDIIMEGCITQEQLLELCLPVLIRIRHLFSRVLRDGQCIAEDIDDVIMVGGSSKLHLVQRFIEELFQKPPVVMADTDEVVAQGVGIYAGIRMRDDDIKDHMMTDVCPFTLGTNVVWGKEDDRAHICPVLERNCPLPFSKTVTLRTVGDYQYLMQIGIYQGEEYYADENVCLGELVVPIREKPAGEESVSVTFSYDINGVLKVEGRNSMNQTVEKLIANEELSEEEIEESLKRLEQLKVPDREEEEYQMLLARLGWLYEQQIGNVREWTGSVIYGLTQARKNGKHHLYRKAKERAEGWLIRAEASLDMFDSFRTEAFYEEEEAEDE